MVTDKSSNNAGRRLVVFAVAAAVLLLSVVSYFVSQLAKKSEVASKTLIPITSVDDKSTVASDTPRVAPVIEVTPDLPQTAPENAAPRRIAARRKTFHSAKNKVAALFPPVPLDNSRLDLQSPKGMVEMWSADKRTFVAVPAGSKFEE